MNTVNEKIKILARQADIKIDGMGYGEGNIEELIKLVVRECAKISVEVDETSTCQGAASAEAFKNYFGVS